MRWSRSVIVLIVFLFAPSCGADSGRGAVPDEEPEAAPQTAPGVEPAEVPESLQQDSSDVR